MEQYIQISKINDFIFCPRSLYFHSIYENYGQAAYHSTPQTVGKIKHEKIDQKRYSTAKRYLSGLEVYSEKYGLAGKIDIYDTDSGILIERKTKVKKIFDGYKYQLYAQMFCLREMGYEVWGLRIHSLADNKKYVVPLPTIEDIAIFEKTLKEIRFFDAVDSKPLKNSQKCDYCIYKPLCQK